MNAIFASPRLAINPRRILIIDDNRDAAKALAMRLRIHGHETRISFDGIAALDIAATFEPGIILLDISMPRLDGYQVCQRLRDLNPPFKPLIIAVTGWADQPHQHQSKQAGFDGFFIKAADDERLIALINTDRLNSVESMFASLESV